jgi:hypothetical protein
MRKIVIAAVVILILGGGAYYGLTIYPNQQFRAALDRTIAELPPGYTVKYGAATYGATNHRAEIDDLSILGPAPLAINETIANVIIEGPTLDFADRWNKAAADPAALTPDQALPVADRIAVQGIKMNGGYSRGTIADTSLVKLRLYPWALLHQGVPALKDIGGVLADALARQKQFAAQEQALIAQEDKAAGADDSQDASKPRDQNQPAKPMEEQPQVDLQTLRKQQVDALMPLLRIEAAALLGFGFDSIDGSGLDVTTTLPADQVGDVGNIHIVAKAIHEGAIDRAIGGANSVDGLVEEIGLNGKNGKISVDHAEIGKITFRDAAMRLLNNEPLSLATANGTSLDKIEMDGLSVSAPTGGTTHIQKIALSDIAFDRGFLKSFAFSIGALKQAAADLDDRGRAILAQVGLQSVTLNLGIGFAWDPDKKTASIHDTMLSVDELGSAQLSADLVNIDPANPGGDEKPALVKASLRYQDASLIDRILAASGEKDPAKLAQMRKQFAAGFLQAFGGLAADPKIALSLKAISDFAAKPNNLTITLDPPMPAPLDALQTELMEGGPQALVTTLGVSVTANQ